MRLTDSGQAFLPYAERILQTVAEGRDIIDEVRNVEIGSLYLGSAFTISTYTLPRILRMFRSRYGGVDVSIHTGRSEQVLAMLQADEVQVGLVRSLSHQDIETVHLYDDEIVLVVNPDHPFSVKGATVVEEVASEPIVLFDRGSSYFGLTHGFFRQAGVVPNIAMELDSLEATKRMVEEGLGIALVPLATIERELQVGRLVKIEMVDAPPLKRPVSLIYKQHRRRPRTVQAFIDTLAEMYAISLPVG